MEDKEKLKSLKQELMLIANGKELPDDGFVEDKAKEFEKGWEEYQAKKKQEIEEIVKLLRDKCASIVYWDYYNDDFNPSYKKELRNVAKIIINAGYRKIDKDSVVLSREEYERLKKQDLFMKDYTIVEVLEKECKKARKETARKLIKTLLDFIHNETFRKGYELKKVERKVIELAKQFGVEIKE